KPITVTIQRGVGGAEAPEEKSFSLVYPAKPAAGAPGAFAEMDALGLVPSELFVFKVTPNSPAEKGGLQPGDRIRKVGDISVYNFESIVDAVQESGEKGGPLIFTLEREGQTVLLDLKPVETSHEDPLTRETKKRFMVGF